MHTHRDIGIYSYLSFSPGIGGKLKKEVEDFYVEEIPVDIPKKEQGKNLIIKVRLRNWETNRFVKLLSHRLGISRNRIRFAGTKDKRSVSVQYFCIMRATDIPETGLHDVEILDSFRTDACLNLGDLIGNRFVIRVSDAKCDERVARIEEELGGFFPNFFGVQRFGAARPTTHIVGGYILTGELQEAVRYYIGYQGDFAQDPGRKIFWDTLDPRAAIKEIDPRAEYERAMLNHLITHPDDYAGALRSLPKNLLIMFVHGYQSYLFNRMVSERLREGIEVREGDIVMKTDARGLPVQEFVRVNSFNIDKIKKLTREGKAYVSTLLFGYASEFSGGVQGEIERRVIREEGIKKEYFRIRGMPELSSRGRRRNIIARYMNFNREDCVFEFTLHPGTYATSLMREFMKQEELQWY
ncbi:MAG: tRNA pseudouridine(13) synthase TruD [Euryarchaeota archaeon]|nr:tRNA pseudouridine(13) synthase TruD [Euryarchaeota archaeon]